LPLLHAIAAVAVLAALGYSAPAAAQAKAPRVRVLGHAHVDARVTRDGGKVSLSGAVVDDAGRPVAGAVVVVSLEHAPRAANAPVSVPLPRAFPEACEPGNPEPEAEGADRLTLVTDAAARFCVALSLESDRYVARVASRETALVEATTAVLSFDLTLAPVTLRFAPERASWSLDDDRAWVSVVASGDSGTPAPGLLLSLSNEQGRALATATTDPSGAARFDVDAATLGAPGPGELRVTFAGNTRAGAAVQSMRIERRARVVLSATQAVGGRLRPAVPEDGIPLSVAASLQCANRGCTRTPSGVVEARVSWEGVVGVAPVAGGVARLLVAFSAPAPDPRLDPGTGSGAGETTVPISFRYVPDAPWLLAPADLVVAQPVRAPSPWRKAPLVLAALAVIAWLALARAPARPRRRKPAPPPERFVPAASIEVVHAEAGAQGWRGRVTDAHEGSPVASARVAIERRDFDGVVVVAETTSDPSGQFELRPITERADDELVADGPRHAMVRRRLPAPGGLAVMLVLRKRALLDRLVAWARRQGPPYASPHEPTPGQIRRAASTEGAGPDGNGLVAQWATAVEEAAYGGSPVDAQAETVVNRLAPPGAR
jgi:hypothetical protein